MIGHAVAVPPSIDEPGQAGRRLGLTTFAQVPAPLLFRRESSPAELKQTPGNDRQLRQEQLWS